MQPCNQGRHHGAIAPPPMISLAPRLDVTRYETCYAGFATLLKTLFNIKGGGTYFHLGGGETKKGTVMSKRALNMYMRIIITNALMKHASL